MKQRPVHLSMLSLISFLPALHIIFFPSCWLLAYIIIFRTMVSGCNHYHQSLEINWTTPTDNSFPDGKFLERSELKAFADDKTNTGICLGTAESKESTRLLVFTSTKWTRTSDFSDTVVQQDD